MRPRRDTRKSWLRLLQNNTKGCRPEIEERARRMVWHFGEGVFVVGFVGRRSWGYCLAEMELLDWCCRCWIIWRGCEEGIGSPYSIPQRLWFWTAWINQIFYFRTTKICCERISTARWYDGVSSSCEDLGHLSLSTPAPVEILQLQHPKHTNIAREINRWKQQNRMILLC